MKLVLREGARTSPSRRQAYAGAALAVHFVGVLFADRSVFDSSFRTGDALRIELGAKQVINGWELGLRTMSWGERAILRCAPEYAYGEDGLLGTMRARFCCICRQISVVHGFSGKDGFKGVIPPAATLDFYIELAGWEPEFRWCSACERLFGGVQCLNAAGTAAEGNTAGSKPARGGDPTTKGDGEEEPVPLGCDPNNDQGVYCMRILHARTFLLYM